MSGKFLIEVDLGRRVIERCDIAVYSDGKAIGTYFDKSYDDLPSIVNKLRAK